MQFVAQGGLSLPDRNYYFDTDAQAVVDTPEICCASS